MVIAGTSVPKPEQFIGVDMRHNFVITDSEK